MIDIADVEYLRIVAKSFEAYHDCPKHGNISKEINRIADRLEKLETQKNDNGTGFDMSACKDTLKKC